jgi:hypothetical protein
MSRTATSRIELHFAGLVELSVPKTSRTSQNFRFAHKSSERRFLAGRLAELKIKFGSAVDFPSA